jgi:hypothetical protein
MANQRVEPQIDPAVMRPSHQTNSQRAIPAWALTGLVQTKLENGTSSLVSGHPIVSCG